MNESRKQAADPREAVTLPLERPPAAAAWSASSPLARYLLAAYVILIVYASLHPWYGWRLQGVHPFAFVTAPWPKYRTWFDTLANLIAYVPLGGFAVAALLPMRRAPAFIIAAGGGALLSFLMESLQTFLPSRVSSNLDLALNAGGAVIGALIGVWWAPTVLAAGGLRSLRARWFYPGHRADVGLVLIGLWLLTQLNPETLLFGTGDLRELIGALPGKSYPAGLFVRIEAVVVGANLMAIGLMLSQLVAPARPRWPLVLGVFAFGLVVRTVAFAVLFQPANALNWLTPGAAVGLTLGAGALALAVRFVPRFHAGIAAVCISLATAVVNIGPENPYLAESLSVWRQGHFFNFNGLTHAVSAVWPFLALAYMFGGDRRSKERF